MPDWVTQSEAWTVGRLLKWIRDFLSGKGLDQPQLCAQLLLAHVLGCRRLDLYLQFDRVPVEDQLVVLRDLVRRSGRNEPIAYLIGRKEFFSLEFAVTPDVLIPRPETETLVQAVLDIARGSGRAPELILDLCTGSGCVAIALAVQLSGSTVVATDISERALRVAEANVARHGLTERVGLRQGDLYDALAGGVTVFDVITANPPYIKTGDLAGLPPPVAEHEPHLALDGGSDGLELIRRIVMGAMDRLKPGGRLAIEVGHDQGAAVRELFVAAGFDDVRSVSDGLGHDRVVIGSRSVFG